MQVFDLLSDEALLESWVENPYWQAFCGMEYFQHEPPIHPSSLSRYRTRLGPAGCEELLRRTIVAGPAEGVIEKRDLTEVLVDTTVMEEAITYPTDSKLYLMSLLRLNRRSVIEALIGHMKVDGLMDRNWLKGTAGDAMHAILCAAGQNLRVLLRAIAAFLRLNVQTAARCCPA